LPTQVSSVGGHFTFSDDQETANCQIALFEFPAESSGGDKSKGEGNDSYARAHARNFIEAVRKRGNAIHQGDIKEGHYTCALIHLANASYRLKRSLVFDPAIESCSQDAEANSLLIRVYRAPFIVPEQV